MGAEAMKGKVKQVRGEAHKRWGRLTRDPMEQLHGEQLKLVGLIQERYGFTREKAQKEVQGFFDKVSHDAPRYLQKRMGQTTKQVSKTVKGASSNISSQASSMSDQVGKLAQDLSKQMSKSSKELSTQARVRAEQVAAQVRETAGEVGSEAKVAGAKVDKTVQSYPWAAVGVAFMSGVLVGLFSMSRRAS